MKKSIVSAVSTALVLVLLFSMAVFAASPTPAPTKKHHDDKKEVSKESTANNDSSSSEAEAQAAANAAAAQAAAQAAANAAQTTTTTTQTTTTATTDTTKIEKTAVTEPAALAAGVKVKSESGAAPVIKKLDDTTAKSAVTAAKAKGFTVLKAMDISVKDSKGGKVTVTGVGNPGMKVTVLHFNGKIWENLGNYTVAKDGGLSFSSKSYSPFAFVVDSKTTVSPKTGDE